MEFDFFLLRKNKNIMEFDVVVVFIVVGDEDWRCFWSFGFLRKIRVFDENKMNFWVFIWQFLLEKDNNTSAFSLKKTVRQHLKRINDWNVK